MSKSHLKMMNKFKNILLLYKNSTYASYFLGDRKRLAMLEGLFNSSQVKRFRKTHENHFWALAYVESVLKKNDLKYTKICRGTAFDYKKYDLVVTVGGDGTFLEAARNLENQLIWGVNSDPTWSVGRFCGGNPDNFETMLARLLNGKIKPKLFNRLCVSFSDGTQEMHVLNDLLICHHSPAALSRYYIKVGKTREEQRSSGVWISTAAGSSGGIYSAGGKILPQESNLMQYRTRELFRPWGAKYGLIGGVLKSIQRIELTSLMREGMVFVDGSHVCLPFSFGAVLNVKHSPHPLRVII